MSRNKAMSKEGFDSLIKQNLITSGISETDFVYSIIQNGGKINEYPLYYNKTAFDTFVDEMKALYPHHYLKYNGNPSAKSNKGGVGGELVEKSGRYGLTPPKMASVASSSRFCYLALRNGTDALAKDKYINGNDIEFEKECRIFSDGTAPQLDAFFTDSGCNVYIEAKCHEIFDSHKVVLKNKYWDYFEKDEVLKSFLTGIQKGTDEFILPLNIFGIYGHSYRFDIKQLICHLLGIKEQNNGQKAKLIYMFFEPIPTNNEDTVLINDVFEELSNEIKLIFESPIIKDFCNKNKIELTAIKEKSKIMEPLTSINRKYIYPLETN